MLLCHLVLLVDLGLVAFLGLHAEELTGNEAEKNEPLQEEVLNDVNQDVGASAGAQTGVQAGADSNMDKRSLLMALMDQVGLLLLLLLLFWGVFCMSVYVYVLYLFIYVPVGLYLNEEKSWWKVLQLKCRKRNFHVFKDVLALYLTS